MNDSQPNTILLTMIFTIAIETFSFLSKVLAQHSEKKENASIKQEIEDTLKDIQNQSGYDVFKLYCKKCKKTNRILHN